MTETIKNLLPAIIGGYLLGSVSFAVVLSKAVKGQDVRTLGSKNAGTTNILRNFGWSVAGLTFAGDLFKGTAAVLLARALTSQQWALYAGYAAALGALIGHMKPVFFGFRGGKGVATGLGSVLALNPAAFAILSAVGFTMAGVTGYVSLASVTCSGAFPFLVALLSFAAGRFDVWESFLAFLLGGLIVFNHRANIKRLLKGTEQKFHPPGRGKKGDASNG